MEIYMECVGGKTHAKENACAFSLSKFLFRALLFPYLGCQAFKKNLAERRRKYTVENNRTCRELKEMQKRNFGGGGGGGGGGGER